MRKSVWISVAMTVILALWMGSGYWNGESGAAINEPAAQEVSAPRLTVMVTQAQAEAMQQRLVVQGQVAALRTVQLRAETSARVVEVPVLKGARVSAGDMVARLAENERPAKLREAMALVKQRATDRAAARELESRQLQAKNRVAETTALYEAARAYEAQLRIDLAHTRITAPFAAVLNDRMVEIGDFVDRGDPIAELVDDSVLLVEASVPQHDVAKLRLGVEAQIELITGEVLQGKLVYIATRAAASTRSFPIEIEVANTQRIHAIGMSAEVRIPTEVKQAHFISLSVLTLNANGDIGVKVVDDEDTVRFKKVALVQSKTGGAWVSGLPARARVIVQGQGFARDGDVVNVALRPQTGQ
ncbi:MAG: efflux RND transporter periplasmic adaptor subunit [Gammaproteobacteria bacterium]|nr:efflux RND transporter periplasmic adaptor subunit [Gammaproteobacteria bacterium]